MLQAREALIRATNDGSLEQVIDEVVREKKEKDAEDYLNSAREKMKNALVNAMEDGRLELALHQHKVEQTLAKARAILAEAAESGRLECAIAEVIQEKEMEEQEDLAFKAQGALEALFLVE